MIEFKGYISGNAEKYFHKKNINFLQNVLLASILIFLPLVIYFAVYTKSWPWLIFYSTLFIIFPLIARIPKSKKEKISITPKRIYTEGDRIVCVADKYKEYRLINDAKLVRDYGDFYEVVFPFGKISNNFICQKVLLTKGTVDEFEKLFKGKIIKV